MSRPARWKCIYCGQQHQGYRAPCCCPGATEERKRIRRWLLMLVVLYVLLVAIFSF